MEKLYDKGKKIGFYYVTLLLLSSCATIFNGKRTKVRISADSDSKIVYLKDTIKIGKKQITIYPKRSKEVLKIEVLKDSLHQDFFLKKKLSRTFISNVFNLPFTYGLSIGLDLTNKKRFTYKRNLHFRTDLIKNKIILSNKKVELLPKKQLFIYTNPLRSVDIFSMPLLTLGTEYFFKDNFSISLEYGIKIPGINISRRGGNEFKEKGNLYRLEGKLYNKTNLTKNAYLNEYFGLETIYINGQYNDATEYALRNSEQNSNNIRDEFVTQLNIKIINIKYGILVPVSKRFYFDLYTGLGLRIQRFQDKHLEYDSNIHVDLDDFPNFDIRDFSGINSNHLNLSLGFKFGYKF